MRFEMFLPPAIELEPIVHARHVSLAERARACVRVSPERISSMETSAMKAMIVSRWAKTRVRSNGRTTSINQRIRQGRWTSARLIGAKRKRHGSAQWKRRRHLPDRSNKQGEPVMNGTDSGCSPQFSRLKTNCSRSLAQGLTLTSIRRMNSSRISLSTDA